MEENYNIVFTEELKIKPAFRNNYICLVFCSNDDFLKYASVMITSIMENSSSKHNYDVLILHKNISHNNMELLMSQIENLSNFSIRFINLKNLIRKSGFYVKSIYHEVTEESYYRLYIPEVLSEEYSKAVYLDGDMISLTDLYKLDEIEINNYYLAAVKDYLGIAECYRNDLKGERRKQYQLTKVGIHNIENYFISALMIMNLKLLRKDFNIQEKENLIFKEKWLLYDQDVLNYMCRNDMVLFIDAKWNVLGDYGEIKYLPKQLQKEYYDSEREPFVSHYGGPRKPWLENAPREELFWHYASISHFYIYILINAIISIVNKRREKSIDYRIAESTRKIIKNSKIYTSIDKICEDLVEVDNKNNELQNLIVSLEERISFFSEQQNIIEEKNKALFLNILYEDTKKYRKVLLASPFQFVGQKDTTKKIMSFLSENSDLICKKEIIGHIGVIEFKLLTKKSYFCWLISMIPFYYYRIKEQIEKPRKK